MTEEVTHTFQVQAARAVSEVPWTPRLFLLEGQVKRISQVSRKDDWGEDAEAVMCCPLCGLNSSLQLTDYLCPGQKFIPERIRSCALGPPLPHLPTMV